jgi:hypothetical protein
MIFMVINLMQSQPAKASWLLWVAASLFFLVGLGLLIYLIINSKKADQLEDIEEAGAGGGLLSKERLSPEFEQKVSTVKPTPAVQPTEQAETPEPAEPGAANHTIPLFSEADISKAAAPEITAPAEPEAVSTPSPQAPFEAAPQSAEAEAESPTADDVTTLQASPEPEIHREPAAATADDQAPDSRTRVLSSQTTAPIVEAQTMPLEAMEEEIYSPQEEALFSRTEASPVQPSPAVTDASNIALSGLEEEPASARLTTPAAQQRLAQSPKSRREPFEPPTIEPLTPRATATQELSSQAAESRKTTTMNSPAARKTSVMASPSEIFAEPPADSGTLPLSSAQTSFKNLPQTKPQTAPQWEGAGTRSIERKAAGSVLGLPAEASDAPLIIGQPLHPRDEEGVAALSNYGKDLDATETGRGGAITLLVAVLLIAGAVLLYFFVPAVRSRTDALIARVRGQQNLPVAVEKPKVQIYPALNPEVNKNLVKARGAVMNISEETLEDLSVEVSLDRGEGTTPEVRTIAVKPNVLTPRQQGLYEFEYEGGKTSGFSRYRVTRLMSKNGEVKFKTPNQ